MLFSKTKLPPNLEDGLPVVKRIPRGAATAVQEREPARESTRFHRIKDSTSGSLEGPRVGNCAGTHGGPQQPHLAQARRCVDCKRHSRSCVAAGARILERWRGSWPWPLSTRGDTGRQRAGRLALHEGRPAGTCRRNATVVSWDLSFTWTRTPRCDIPRNLQDHRPIHILFFPSCGANLPWSDLCSRS